MRQQVNAEVTEEDWELAGLVMDTSDRTRTGVLGTLAAAAAEQNLRRGRAEGQRAVIAARVVEDDAVRRVAALVRRKLTAAGGSMLRCDLTRALASRDRRYFEPAIEWLEQAGQVKVEDIDEGGTRYWLVGTS